MSEVVKDTKLETQMQANSFVNRERISPSSLHRERRKMVNGRDLRTAKSRDEVKWRPSLKMDTNYRSCRVAERRLAPDLQEVHERKATSK